MEETIKERIKETIQAQRMKDTDYFMIISRSKVIFI